MSDIRLLAVDLDNTLLTAEKKISAKNKYWIQKTEEQGIKVVLATGRGVERTREFWEELSLNDPLVLVNGAELWKTPGELLERHTLTGEEAKILIGLALKNKAGYWGYNLEGMVRSSDWTEKMYIQRWLKIGFKHEDISVIQRLKKEVQSLNHYAVTQSGPLNLEISPWGTSKAYGLKKICAYLQIDLDSVMAIGDNLNDLEMIQTAGLGVAVENADKRLKLAADALTASNEADGVAEAIRRYIFKAGSKGLEVRKNEFASKKD
ncbi:MAG: HAD family phosphatase [Firmicutes bacterium]|nr:HAD family phosphatase [Bacillota bacterium]